MNSESRDEMLTAFQNCTGLEHLEECIQILQQYDWNLMDAIQAVHEKIGHSIDDESTVPVRHTTNSSVETDAINSSVNNNKHQSDLDEIGYSEQPQTIESTPARDLNFTIEYGDRIERITIPDNESVYQLRVKMFEKFSIPSHQQTFLYWPMMNYNDQIILKDLYLPKENTICLLSRENDFAEHTTSSVKSSQEFPITILCDDKSGQLISHELVLQSDTTINEIKQQVEHLTQIPINQQIWQGLLGAKDTDELRETLISPRAPLIVHQIDIPINQSRPTSTQDSQYSAPTIDRNEDELMDIDQNHSLESYEDNIRNNSTTSFNTATTSYREPLIPNGCTDDTHALEHFARVFHTRYGSSGPILYIGSLEQAIQDSLYLSIHTRRPLAIYLHNDQSVCANVFCSQVLSTDSIVEYLANNYVLWAWDVTFDENRTRLFEVLQRCVGHQCTQRVASMENNSFPLLLIIVRSRGLLELMTIVEGKSTPTEVLLELIQSHESFEQQRLRNVDEETMRETRENLKKQQEDEYEQSLQADLAKERARQEEHDASERLKQQRLKQQQESKARLSEEPSETEANITQLKIRLPNNDGVLMRRFHISDNLQMLFDYLTSEGRMFGEYKLLTTYPKRNLTTHNHLDTFEQLKLYPQEQLILEYL